MTEEIFDSVAVIGNNRVKDLPQGVNGWGEERNIIGGPGSSWMKKDWWPRMESWGIRAPRRSYRGQSLSWRTASLLMGYQSQEQHAGRSRGKEGGDSNWDKLSERRRFRVRRRDLGEIIFNYFFSLPNSFQFNWVQRGEVLSERIWKPVIIHFWLLHSQGM